MVGTGKSDRMGIAGIEEFLPRRQLRERKGPLPPNARRASCPELVHRSDWAVPRRLYRGCNGRDVAAEDLLLVELRLDHGPSRFS